MNRSDDQASELTDCTGDLCCYAVVDGNGLIPTIYGEQCCSADNLGAMVALAESLNEGDSSPYRAVALRIEELDHCKGIIGRSYVSSEGTGYMAISRSEDVHVPRDGFSLRSSFLIDSIISPISNIEEISTCEGWLSRHAIATATQGGN